MKLRKKIFLSATALAACAATLTTTTYAWYVSNTTATVDGITGSVSSTGKDGNLLVAADKGFTPDDFSDKINLAAYLNAPKSGLTPVSYVADGYVKTNDTALVGTKTYYTSSGSAYTEVTSPEVENIATYFEKTNWVDDAGTPTDASALTFRIWVTSTTKKTVTPVLNIKNTSTSAKVQQLKNTTGAPKAMNPTTGTYGSSAADVQKNTDFTSNAVYAMRVGITKVTGQAATTGSGAKTAAENTEIEFNKQTMTVYNPAAINTPSGIKITKPATTDAAWNYTIDGDANAYFAALLNRAPYGTTGTSTDKYEAITIAVGTPKSEVDKMIASNNYVTVSGETTAALKEADFEFKDEVVAGETIKVVSTAVNAKIKAGKKVTAVSASESSTDWGSFTLEANEAVMFEFTVWLEGSDAQCFDSCKGQTFDFNFEFSASNVSA